MRQPTALLFLSVRVLPSGKYASLTLLTRWKVTKYNSLIPVFCDAVLSLRSSLQIHGELGSFTVKLH